MLCWWKSETWKFSFIKWVDEGQITTMKDLENWCVKSLYSLWCRINAWNVSFLSFMLTLMTSFDKTLLLDDTCIMTLLHLKHTIYRHISSLFGCYLWQVLPLWTVFPSSGFKGQKFSKLWLVRLQIIWQALNQRYDWKYQSLFFPSLFPR